MARKPGLGKGLGALIPEGSASEEVIVVSDSGGPLRMLQVTSIRPNPFQPRKSFTDESLQTLASSVRELGVLQPIIVRPVEGEANLFELIAGERRWRAAGLAGLDVVPVLVQDDVNERNISQQLRRAPAEAPCQSRNVVIPDPDRNLAQLTQVRQKRLKIGDIGRNRLLQYDARLSIAQ